MDESLPSDDWQNMMKKLDEELSGCLHIGKCLHRIQRVNLTCTSSPPARSGI